MKTTKKNTTWLVHYPDNRSMSLEVDGNWNARLNLTTAALSATTSHGTPRSAPGAISSRASAVSKPTPRRIGPSTWERTGDHWGVNQSVLMT